MINKRICKTGALAVAATVVFTVFAFRAADWTKGLNSEFIVYGQNGTGVTGGSGSTGGTTTKVIAQIAAGNYGDVEPRNYGTIVEVINNTTAAESLSGNFYNEDGTAATAKFTTNLSSLPTFTTGSFSNVSLPAGAIFVISVGTDPAATPANSSTMWGKVTSNGAFTMASFFELRNSGSRALSARVGVPASPANITSFIIPRVRQTPGQGNNEIDTGFALVNTSSSAPAVLTAKIFDANGIQVGASKFVTLGPNQHIANFASALFGLTGEASTRQYQYLSFTSSSPTIAATALSTEAGTLTSFPVDVIQ